MVHLVFGVTDLGKAKAWLANPELKKVMDNGGVISASMIKFYNDYSKEKV